VLLNVTSGPSAVLWGRCGHRACRAFGFANSGLGKPSRIRFARCQAVSLSPQHPRRRAYSFAIANTLTTYGVRPTLIKDQLEAPADLAYGSLEFVSFLRITVAHSENKPTGDVGVLRRRLPRSTIEQRSLKIDGGAGTSIYRFDGKPCGLGVFCATDVSNLAYCHPESEDRRRNRRGRAAGDVPPRPTACFGRERP